LREIPTIAQQQIYRDEFISNNALIILKKIKEADDFGFEEESYITDRDESDAMLFTKVLSILLRARFVKNTYGSYEEGYRNVEITPEGQAYLDNPVRMYKNTSRA
jgi:hypothetical protein